MTNSKAKKHLEEVKQVKHILKRVERLEDLSESQRKALQTDVRNIMSDLDKVIRFVKYAKSAE